MKQPQFTAEELRQQVKIEINASVLPKQEPGKTSTILCRGSRLGTKRGKKEYKAQMNNKNHSIERNAIIHQIVQHKNPKMNLKVILN